MLLPKSQADSIQQRNPAGVQQLAFANRAQGQLLGQQRRKMSTGSGIHVSGA